MANTIATYEEVKQFLDQMKTRLVFLGGRIILDKKAKNEQFMVSMDWHSLDTIKDWLRKLEPEDYYEGPDPNENPKC